MQGDRWTDIMQAPRLTTLDGEQASVRVGGNWSYALNSDGKLGEFFVGTSFDAKARVTDDRKRVQLAMKLEHGQPVYSGPQAANGSLVFVPLAPQGLSRARFETKVTIPDGQTLVLSAGPVEITNRVEYTPPVLGKIPYIGRLFKNVGYGRETRQMIVLVTPRIVKEEAAIAAWPVPPNRLLPATMREFQLPQGDVILTGHAMPAQPGVRERSPGKFPLGPMPDASMLGSRGLKFDVDVAATTWPPTFTPFPSVRVDSARLDPLAIWPRAWMAQTRPARETPEEPVVNGDNGECPAVSCVAHIKVEARSALTIADVETLSEAGVSDAVIITQIRSTGSTFNLTAPDLIRLSKKRVSDEVIMTMQSARMSAPTIIRSIGVEFP
jgi:hypothetical protein